MTTEDTLRHLKRVLGRYVADGDGCGRGRLSLTLTNNGVLRMVRVAGASWRGGSGRRCGLVGDHSGAGVGAVKVNVHDLGKVGASSGRGQVTVYCRRSGEKCVTLTRHDGTTVWSGRFVLRLGEGDPTAVRRVARAMRRFLWFVNNDWRYTRPSSRAQRADLRSSGRRLRNWGIGLVIPGGLATGLGAVLVAYSLSCTSGGLTCLGHALIGALGAVFLIPGAIVTAVGIPMIFIGVGKISDSLRPEHQLDFDAPRPTVPPTRTAPLDDGWWIVRHQRRVERPDLGRRTFMMNLRFRF